MPMELSKETANEYFATLNPIAKKISMDINETKSSYEHIWNQLSANEQIDIINETLIKPEIALRYFDNFSTSSSSSVSLCNDDYVSDENKLKFCDKLKTKSIYNYDGKNIITYTAQKTGLKVVHDEVFGVFRDEHSAPFSNKTKSQMNLKLFNDIDSKDRTEGSSIGNMHQNLAKYKKSNINSAGIHNKNKPLKSLHPSIEKTDLKNSDKVDGKRKTFHNEESMGNSSLGTYDIMDVDRDDGKGNFLSKFICKNNLIFNAGTNLIIKAGDVGQYNEDEGITLIKNISSSCYSGLTSSSSVPSEEDEDKQICEDSKLLLENDELRKGFDFLNNW